MSADQQARAAPPSPTRVACTATEIVSYGRLPGHQDTPRVCCYLVQLLPEEVVGGAEGHFRLQCLSVAEGTTFVGGGMYLINNERCCGAA